MNLTGRTILITGGSAAWMRRLAPDFINGQLWKASRALVPVGAG